MWWERKGGFASKEKENEKQAYLIRLGGRRKNFNAPAMAVKTTRPATKKKFSTVSVGGEKRCSFSSEASQTE